MPHPVYPEVGMTHSAAAHTIFGLTHSVMEGSANISVARMEEICMPGGLMYMQPEGQRKVG